MNTTGAERTTVLILSSDKALRGSVESLLSEAGLKGRGVESSHQALDAITSQYYPVVLIDWETAALDGKGLCAAIREWPSLGHVYILAAVDRSQAQSMEDSGTDDYIVKPLEKTDFAARLRVADRIIGLELALSESAEEVMLLALVDPVTGVYNRTYLSRQLPQEIKRARRYKRPLSVILASVDKFDELHELHGRIACDAALTQFVDSVGEKLRTGIDWVARAGEKEFMIVLPETPPESAGILAERLRRVASDASIEQDGQTFTYTMSCGVTGFDPKRTEAEVTMSALLSSAAEYLKACEESGYNCIKGGQL
jgi:two-component system cell cycle response regulator